MAAQVLRKIEINRESKVVNLAQKRARNRADRLAAAAARRRTRKYQVREVSPGVFCAC